MDGAGYPYGLTGDQIPLMARIIAVADTLDAITTNRPYQSAMDLEFAMDRIRSLAVSRFDPKSSPPSNPPSRPAASASPPPSSKSKHQTENLPPIRMRAIKHRRSRID